VEKKKRRVMQPHTKEDTQGLWQLVDVLLEDLHNMLGGEL